MTIKFFKSSSQFRIWLEANHGSALELWVGFYKKASGHASITWPESVDQALCFGWIDGLRKSIDEVSYKIRFTPRKPRSIWSVVNIKRANELTAQGLMSPAGKRAFDQRTENRSGIYSYEQRPAELPDPYRATLKQNKAAWDFYEAQPPSYRRLVCWWIISAKKEETKIKRLDRLIKFSAQGQRLPETSGRTAQGGEV
jgi:uncharacterized protein YdeI (YjbR/CyaY-like superfamily)